MKKQLCSHPSSCQEEMSVCRENRIGETKIKDYQQRPGIVAWSYFVFIVSVWGKGFDLIDPSFYYEANYYLCCHYHIYHFIHIMSVVTESCGKSKRCFFIFPTHRQHWHLKIDWTRCAAINNFYNA